MNIILTEDVESLGSAGDLLKVKDGYARNYLMPGGKAMVATTQNVKMLEHQKQLVQAKLNKMKREAEQLARKIENISCTVAKPVGEEADLSAPFVIEKGSTVEEFALRLHRDFYDNLKSARVWGSSDFDGQMVSRDYVLHDKDIVELKI